jgi:LacI family transcriptional regulator
VKIGAFTKEFGITATRELMQTVPRPTAILTTSNRLLMGTMTVLAEQHIRVPDDLSIISFDDSEWLSFWQPPITTVDIAIDEMGALAVELVLRGLNNPTPRDTPHTYSLGTTLIERQSCERIAVSVHEA